MDGLTFDDFAAHVGSVFQLVDDEVELTITAAHPHSTGFSVLYSGPADRAVGQGTYVFRQSEPVDAAEHAIFIVPLGPKGDGTMQYEAVFTTVPDAPVDDES